MVISEFEPEHVLLAGESSLIRLANRSLEQKRFDGTLDPKAACSY